MNVVSYIIAFYIIFFGVQHAIESISSGELTKTLVGIIFQLFLLFLGVLIIIVAIFSSKYYQAKIALIVALSILYVIISVYATLRVKKVENNLENSSKKNNRFFFALSKFIVAGVASLCMLSAESVSKATFYLIRYNNYCFSPELNKTIEENRNKELKVLESKKKLYELFLNDVESLDKVVFEVENTSLSTLLEWNKKSVQLPDSYDFSLQYKFIYGTKETGSIHQMWYEKKRLSGKKDCFVNYKSDLLKRKNLIAAIQNQLHDMNIGQNFYKERLTNFTLFASSAFLEYFKVKGYEITAKDKRTENIDLVLSLFTGLMIIYLTVSKPSTN